MNLENKLTGESKMKRIITIFAFVLIAAFAAQAQTAMEKALEAKEKSAWDAFGKGDGKFFETFLTANSLIVGETGMASRAQSVKDINTKPCDIKSYSFKNFKVTMLNPTTALVTYEAEQDTTCGGQPAPKKMYCSSIYVKEKGKWVGAFHQETIAIELPPK
jgi:hypothetical protein